MTKTSLPGPANFSIHAAISAGYLSHNALVTAINGKALTVPQSVAALLSTGTVDPSQPASTLGLGSFGGD